MKMEHRTLNRWYYGIFSIPFNQLMHRLCFWAALFFLISNFISIFRMSAESRNLRSTLALNNTLMLYVVRNACTYVSCRVCIDLLNFIVAFLSLLQFICLEIIMMICWFLPLCLSGFHFFFLFAFICICLQRCIIKMSHHTFLIRSVNIKSCLQSPIDNDTRYG